MRNFLLLVVLLAAIAAAAAGWLLGSTAGARWAFSELSRRTAVSLEAEGVEGRLYDVLRLRGVRIAWPGGEACISDSTLRWHPLRLLSGDLRIDELKASGGYVAWKNLPPEPGEWSASFTWPQLGGWPVRLRGTLGALQVDDLELRPPDGEPLRIDGLKVGLGWQGGLLELSGLDAEADGFRLEGSAEAGFDKPRLGLDLRLGFPEEVAGFDLATLKSDLVGKAGTLMGGPLELTGRKGERTQLELAADLTWEGETLRLESFKLSAPGRPGAVTGSGALTIGPEGPAWSLKANLDGVDLSPETGVTTELSGPVEARGDGSGYEGSLDLKNRISGWQSARLAGPFKGNWARLEFPALKGEWLRGTVSGAFRLDWQADFTLKADLRGRHLDPAVITPQWPGRINFDLSGDLSWPAEGENTGNVRGLLLESTLRGRALTGQVAANWQGEDLRIDALELHGEGFDLSGRGRLTERVEFRANVERLSALLPEGEGAFSAQGWLAWRDGAAAGELDLSARDLAYEELRVGSLRLTAGVPGGERPLAVAARGSRLVLGRWQLQSVTIDLAGRTEKHTLAVHAGWPQGELQMVARGGWRQGLWSGVLERLSGDDPDAGSWRLVEPVELAAGVERLHLGSLLLEGAGGAKLRLAADLFGRPLQGDAHAHWEEIDLSRANPWLGEVILAGRSTGKARFHRNGEGGLEIETGLSASGMVRYSGQSLVVPELKGELHWGKAGLNSMLAVRLGQNGEIEGRLSSPEPPHLPFPHEWTAEALWQNFDLAVFGPWLEPAELSGQSSGNLRARLSPDGSLDASGSAEAAGRFRDGELQVEVSSARSDFRWDHRGLHGEVLVELTGGGNVAGRIDSRRPGRLGWPDDGHLKAEWSGIELTPLQPFLPAGIVLEGEFSGRGSGQWLPGGELTLVGEAGVDGGRFSWQEKQGVISAELRRAHIDWQWHHESLRGTIDLALAEKGAATGHFRLPLPARLPVRLVPGGELELALDARMRELGLVSFFFPGQMRESRGEISIQAKAGGTWEKPQFGGTFHLSGAGAYIPPAGIELREVEVVGVLAGEELRIESFSALSGPGRIGGSGSVRLNRWLPVAYRAELAGERFETVYLPELHVLANPRLSIEGTPEKLKIRGQIEIPELQFRGREQREIVRENPDVVIVGAVKPEKSFPIALDIELQLVLGDKVFVKVAGVDARLGGEINLRVTGPDAVTARGEIRSVKGTYSVYGVELDIVRGRLLYSGGPIDQPDLDILALRTAGEVKAGVQVGGKPRNPVVKLYSEPSMPDTDILSYIVLGYPMGDEPGQAGLLAAAAGALLARDESVTLQSQIRQRFGLDVLTVERGGGKVDSSMVTIGKYLNPDLYLSFGQSLFSDASETRLRYTISPRWEIESKMGAEQSGVDLYYKIEFE